MHNSELHIYWLGKRHISILSTRNVIWTLGVGEGVGACDVFRLKIAENFDCLLKIFNILKSSIQNPAFCKFVCNLSIYVCSLAGPGFALTLNLKACQINKVDVR